jgi:hypothetical protein
MMLLTGNEAQGSRRIATFVSEHPSRPEPPAADVAGTAVEHVTKSTATGVRSTRRLLLAYLSAQIDGLAERHSRAHAELVTAMDGPRYAALLAALEAFVINPPWATRVTKVAARLTMTALVGRACARVDRAALAARNVDDAPGADGIELHEVHKAAKRACYAAEMAGSSAGPAAHVLAARMEELQAVLGRHQDSLMVRGHTTMHWRRHPPTT